MGSVDGWTILGEHPADVGWLAASDGGARIRVRRGCGEASIRWVGPMPWGDGRWEAAPDDGSVRVSCLLESRHVPQDVWRYLEARAEILGCPGASLRVMGGGAVVSDGEPRDPLTPWADVDQAPPCGNPEGWLATQVRAIATAPVEPSAMAGTRLMATAAPVRASRVSVAKSAALALVLGVAAGGILTGGPPRYVEVWRDDGAEGLVMTCGDERFEASGDRIVVPAHRRRCTVSVPKEGMSWETTVDTNQARKYRCMVTTEGLRCDQD